MIDQILATCPSTKQRKNSPPQELHNPFNTYFLISEWNAPMYLLKEMSFVLNIMGFGPNEKR